MSFLLTSTRTIKLFFAHSNSPYDEKLRKNLKSHLSSLQPLKVSINWQKNQTLAGRDWKQESYQHVNTSQVIVLLISPDFLSADDCTNIMRQAMEQHNAGKASVIPVKLRPIDNWQATPFGHLQCLPYNGEPITSRFWPRQDDAFVDIVGNIRQEVEKIQEDRRQLQLIQAQQKAEIFASINRFISNHSLNRIIRYRNVPIFLVGIASSVIGIAVLLGFCNSLPEMQVNNLLSQGQDKLGKRDYKGASENYTEVLKIAPKNINAYIKRGDARYSLKDYKAAIKDYTQAIKIEPKNVNAYIKRGDAQYFIKKYQTAIDDYTKAIRLSPDSAEAYKNRGFVYDNNLQNKQEAIKNYQKAATLYKKQGATDKYEKIIGKIQKLQQRKPQSSN
ncbi:MAG: toll/interleukin-1 receptor domain-containing protein [Nostoc sp. CmiVER01]|uniref:toll/interleukin-1 receptor domain-containing protein n=1 Tax=Nostoc sp. CmiVER01 TaxID=3075384 RepID=UPI002AD46066|nr:tetratricopeptide repeat protein [Nostoc sp. CmiVER01]MDZ8122840.1 tetratricopeptide repeat protein [Nostoc sp. CmiVER01]